MGLHKILVACFTQIVTGPIVYMCMKYSVQAREKHAVTVQYYSIYIYAIMNRVDIYNYTKRYSTLLIKV